MARMPDVNAVLEEAKQCFGRIGADADTLAVDEAQNALGKVQLRDKTRQWRRYATQTSAELNSLAPYMRVERMQLLRATNLMLAEIIHAPSDEVAAERYHARRDEIENGLIRLSD